jgi:pyruvate dehydrogenase E2 component (dihydrolipoamide acetyltransferase)
MATQIKLPNLGENVESGDVLSILVREGDTVSTNQDLLEIETDKATMPIPSPNAGKVVKILVKEGDTISVGAPIMEIDVAEGAEKSPSKPAAPPTKQARPAVTPAKESEPDQAEERAKDADVEAGDVPPDEPAPPQSDEEQDEPAEVDATEPVRPKKSAPATAAKSKKPAAAAENGDVPGDGRASAAAGPAVRRLARQLGVELRRVRPTGSGGRITVEDVRAHVRETNEQVAATMPRGVTPPGAPDTDDFGGVRIEKMSRLRQTIARNMIESYTKIPQLTNFDDADVTELEDMRQQSMQDYGDRGIKLTALPFLIKAVASSLKRHPLLNASVDMGQNLIVYKEYVHIGIAVDTERGLVVPVLRDADRKSISQIAAELDELATTVREGKFDLEILRGGTFTISNLGSVGGTYSTPLINPPQVGILLSGRSRIVPQLVDSDGVAVEPRLMMPLSITYDHRLVDGAAAARFLNEVKSYLTAPGRLLLAP